MSFSLGEITMKFRSTLCTAVSTFSLSLVCAFSAQADIVTQSFSGVIDQVGDPVGVSSQLSSIIHIGDSFNGTFSYDSNWAPFDMTPYCGSVTCSTYQLFQTGNSQQISLTIGTHAYSATAGSNGSISLNDYGINFFGLSGPSSGDLTPTYATFHANATTAPGSFTWPTAGFGNPSFTNPRVSVVFLLPGCDQAGRCFFEAGGAIAPVPEPETYAMLLAGLAMVGALSRRRARAGASLVV